MMHLVPQFVAIPRVKSPPPVVAAAGEHLVAGYLSALGLLVSLPRAHTPVLDLVATDPTGAHSVQIQVKTGRSAYRHRKRLSEREHCEFQVNADEALRRVHATLWWVFADLCDWPHASCPEGASSDHRVFSPEFLVVHSSEICELLAEPGKWANLRIPIAEHARFFQRWDRIYFALHQNKAAD
jgi:hypothetical protein